MYNKQGEAVMFHLVWGGIQCFLTFQVNGKLYHCVRDHIFLSVADVALQCFLDKLEAALVQK